MLQIRLEDCGEWMSGGRCVICDAELVSLVPRRPAAFYGGERLGCVCAWCVARGVDRLKVQLPKYAAELRSRAEDMDEWASGPIRCITPEELKAAQAENATLWDAHLAHGGEWTIDVAPDGLAHTVGVENLRRSA